jgi:hypothetical protein
MGRNYRVNWLDREAVTRGSPGGPTLINLSMTPRCGHFRGNESRAAHTASRVQHVSGGCLGDRGRAPRGRHLDHIGRRRHAHVDLDGDRGHQRQTAPPESFGKGSAASAKQRRLHSDLDPRGECRSRGACFEGRSVRDPRRRLEERLGKRACQQAGRRVGIADGGAGPGISSPREPRDHSSASAAPTSGGRRGRVGSDRIDLSRGWH